MPIDELRNPSIQSEIPPAGTDQSPPQFAPVVATVPPSDIPSDSPSDTPDSTVPTPAINLLDQSVVDVID